ncbi:MAG: prepilin-type N-terminal cleavage/methylation domain-containing protein [Betaproteobacteria bacterium]
MTRLRALTFSAADAGFTLIEVAIVLFVLALLGGAILVPLGAQVEQRQYDETTRSMNDVRDALLGFAVVNKRLPCPTAIDDSPTADGLERLTGSACTSAQGYLPWTTLGGGAIDAWGQHLLYRVTPAFANSGTPITLSSTPLLSICQAVGVGCPSTANVVAVVLSKGKNQGTCPGGCPDEVANLNYGPAFVSRVRSQPGGGNEFDDVVVWVPATTLFSRMIAANLLP